MKFKIKVNKDKIIGNIVMIVLYVIVYICFVIFAYIQKNKEILIGIPLFCIPMVMGQLDLFRQMQWYEIYIDKIVVKNIYGKVNEVYFSAVKEIQEKRIATFTRDSGKKYYIFLDGRPLRRWYEFLTCDNHKKTCVRVLVTDELKKFIIEEKQYVVINIQ